MCSASDRRRALLRWSAPFLLCALASACENGKHESMALAEAPVSDRPVGPIPGPQRDGGSIDNPYAGDPIALNQGRQYFLRYNCAGCHGDHAGGGMGPSLRDGDWIYGGSDSAVFASIAEGRAHGMPAWGTKLPADVVWKLAAYVKSLRTDQEPSPPDQTIPPPPKMP